VEDGSKTVQMLIQEGNKHTSVEIVANEMIILSERRESGETPVEPGTVDEEEFPF
jgi:hypothetical protein